jgi:hypothetical protein
VRPRQRLPQKHVAALVPARQGRPGGRLAASLKAPRLSLGANGRTKSASRKSTLHHRSYKAVDGDHPRGSDGSEQEEAEPKTPSCIKGQGIPSSGIGPIICIDVEHGVWILVLGVELLAPIGS